ncbi:hypothetical protein QMP26_08140 [Enterocloster clostridioformis]
MGLAEVMDYLDVIHGGDRMMDIIPPARIPGKGKGQPDEIL